jgi:MFS family permease
VAASCGAALASGCVAATAAALSVEQMAAWGWRLPFILGGVLAPASIVAALWFTPDDGSAAQRPAALDRGAPATEATVAAAASPVRVRPGLSKSDTQPSALLAGRKTKTKFWG